MPTRRIDETVTVRIGMLGHAGDALGTAHLHAELTGTLEEQAHAVGQLFADAWRRALTEAAREFQPHMSNHFRDQGNAQSGPVSE